MWFGDPFFNGCRFTQSSSSICTSMPLGSCRPAGTSPSLQTNTPELPPGRMCRHSMWRMKFSYCFADRITPIGWPLQTSSPSLTVT